MSSSHVAGAGAGAIFAAVIVAVCNHFNWHVSDVDASVIGSVALSAGVGLGHAIEKGGVAGLFSALWKGNKPSA